MQRSTFQVHVQSSTARYHQTFRKRLDQSHRASKLQKHNRRKMSNARCRGDTNFPSNQATLVNIDSLIVFLFLVRQPTFDSLIMFFSCVNSFLPLASVLSPASTMGRKFVRYRGASPTPYSESESDTSQIIVKKTVTKEKSSNWGWTRASQTSSVSSVTEPARSASPVRVSRHRSSSRHHHRRHRSRHEYHHHHHSLHHSHPKALDHQHHGEHRRRRRRYSEDAPPPRVEEKEVVHKRCHCQGKPSLPVESHHICASPILLAVPVKPSRKMEEVGGFTYEEWCKRRECVPVPTETIAPKSSISNRSTQTQARTQSEVSDQDNAYRYVAMREPGPQDAVVSCLTLRSSAQFTDLCST